jgi:hypothetical protein
MRDPPSRYQRTPLHLVKLDNQAVVGDSLVQAKPKLE